MALTDVRKTQQAVWVMCDIPDYADEEHLLLPYSREAARAVFSDSQAPEWDSRTNTITREYDPNLFDPNFIKRIWKDWRGIIDPKDPTQRVKGPGLVHTDGRIEYPAACTEENKFALINSRPPEFYLWLQRTASDLARAVSREKEEARETFRAVDAASAGLSEREL